MLRILLLLFFAQLSGCVHTREFRHPDELRLPGQSSIWIEDETVKYTLNKEIRPGDQIVILKSPAKVVTSQGVLEIIPTVQYAQHPLHPDLKFPYKEGYSISSREGWIYRIQKEKPSKFGFPGGSEFVANYDATPKVRQVPLGEKFIVPALEDGFVKAFLQIQFQFPNPKEDISIEIPLQDETQSEIRAIKFNLKYIDRWEAARFSP